MKNILSLTFFALVFVLSSFTTTSETFPPKSDWILVQDLEAGTWDLIDDGVKGCLLTISVEEDGSWESEYVGDC